ncbi:hypothetical protein DEIPH_ctg035orf0037 [Deinococcus phoenicis]|uniref:Uncharacterized protein n=1 Tax=Deinococcus phoenicis TaxID=1476583 RepID=A0A016QPC2_9DEIO|nr:hypothetical protein [Deinococcus phoenicis]EYB67594.1 hypothetical protein DEIPH_ctg035orf0037 [Deinococcus phoenicis]
MLDNILNSVRRGAERVQRRGEEVTQSARLRLEVFQLNRELDALYARLGRSYHAGADLDVLQELRGDIRRVDEEISARERLLHELGSDPAGEGHEGESLPHLPAARGEEDRASRPAPSLSVPTPGPLARTEPTVPAAVPPLQEPFMTHRDAENDVPTTPDPTVQHSDELLVPGDATASQGTQAREQDFVRKHQLDEGRRASQDPDPLDQ